MNFTFKGPCIVKYMPIIAQQDATIYSLFISVNRSTCFEWYLHPSSGALVTLSTKSGISKTVTATCLERAVPEKRTAVYRYKQTVYSCILLGNYWHTLHDARTLEYKMSTEHCLNKYIFLALM